ncbi:MAG: hypothetical protein L6Q37_10450 [Bdellovibrionaceae bacterium]|nr:hypothetical protein [Pseudobdellovibrionaceae bacterium]NUM58592.1 barstar family protein [Pseudobdellovibrionaceae bacterium]
MKFFLILINLLCLNLYTAKAQYLKPTEDQIAEVDELNDRIYISIEGNKVSNTEQIFDCISKSLHFENTADKSLESLKEQLSNSKYTSKETHITIHHGNSIYQRLGQAKWQKLLNVLNSAEEENVNSMGLKNIFIMYWD